MIFVLPQVVEVYKDVPVERPIERVVEVVKEGKMICSEIVFIHSTLQLDKSGIYSSQGRQSYIPVTTCFKYRIRSGNLFVKCSRVFRFNSRATFRAMVVYSRYIDMGGLGWDQILRRRYTRAA